MRPLTIATIADAVRCNASRGDRQGTTWSRRGGQAAAGKDFDVKAGSRRVAVIHRLTDIGASRNLDLFTESKLILTDRTTSPGLQGLWQWILLHETELWG